MCSRLRLIISMYYYHIIFVRLDVGQAMFKDFFFFGKVFCKSWDRKNGRNDRKLYNNAVQYSYGKSSRDTDKK